MYCRQYWIVHDFCNEQLLEIKMKIRIKRVSKGNQFLNHLVEREREIKFIGLFGDRGHRGPYLAEHFIIQYSMNQINIMTYFYIIIQS